MTGSAQAGPPATRPGLARSSPPRCAAAFTLLEILLAVALIALVSATLISLSVHLLDPGARTPEQTFWDASAAARDAALQKDRDVFLRFDDKDRAFVVENGGQTEKFPVAANKDLAIDFLHAASAGGGSVLIGGQLVDTQTLPFVTYYADGTCSPYRVQFHGTGATSVIAIDPWTCARVLTPEATP